MGWNRKGQKVKGEESCNFSLMDSLVLVYLVIDPFRKFPRELKKVSSISTFTNLVLLWMLKDSFCLVSFDRLSRIQKELFMSELK